VKPKRVPYAPEIQASNFHKGFLLRLREILNTVRIRPNDARDSDWFAIPSGDGNVMLPVLRLHDFDRVDAATRYVIPIFLRDLPLVIDHILIGIDNEHTYRVFAQSAKASTVATIRIIHVRNYQHTSLILDGPRPRLDRLDLKILVPSPVRVSRKVTLAYKNPLDSCDVLFRWKSHQ
jgi:hypothetical protein